MLNSSGKISLRGLSVVDDKVIWVSGSGGRVGRSVDGGASWKWTIVEGYENCEFRDIEAFSDRVAIIMAVAEPAYILKTIDGGENWKKVYENHTKGMFLDAMTFSDEKNGFVVGDPIDDKFFLAKTIDGGESWLPVQIYPQPDSAEACFASSGTNIRMINRDQFAFVTGGIVSNLITGRKKIKLPLIQGKSTTGANSIAVRDSLTYIVVGGDFTTEDSTTLNCALTFDGGMNWELPLIPPHGYRSCVEHLSGNTWICCGLNGVDITNDNGKTWTVISKESFHTCRKAKNDHSVYFSGNGGRIGKLID